MEKIEKNNIATALNTLHAKKYIYPTYVSKHNSNSEKQVILLMISNREKMSLSCSKKLSALLIGITSKNNGDFYCQRSFHSFTTKIKLQPHTKVYENKDCLM